MLGGLIDGWLVDIICLDVGGVVVVLLYLSDIEVVILFCVGFIVWYCLIEVGNV